MGRKRTRESLRSEDRWVLKDFRILPFQLEDNTLRNIYYKKHRDVEDRTLFVTNLPPGCPLSTVVQVFNVFGSIESISVGSLKGDRKKPKRLSSSNLRKIDQDFDTNISVGAAEEKDETLRYKKINDIRAVEAQRLARLKKARHMDTSADDSDEEQEDSEQGVEEEKQELRRVPDFIGNQFLHIRFKKASSVEKAMSLDNEQIETLQFDLDEDDWDINVGLNKWILLHKEQIASAEELEREATEFMRNFDALKSKEAAERAAKLNKPDEDGWTLVGPAKKRSKFSDGSIKVSAVKAEEIVVNSKSKRQDNFYKFQKHEKRREQLAELRKQFEEDKQKILQMKNSHQFRPFA